ncbi:hypothetical protein BJ987_006541 [Nocardia goodfellowii]|uniref:Uncharacterized protein n=1 Tax=Nocardia goodfellowii TaxID=882446 RepID=A0ABS4QR46_9NOCA|nr:hypothetical protein [Nocardia goodfellowii]
MKWVTFESAVLSVYSIVAVFAFPPQLPSPYCLSK